MSSPEFFHYDYDHNPTAVGLGIEYYLRDASVDQIFFGPVMPDNLPTFSNPNLEAHFSKDHKELTIHNKLTEVTYQFENLDSQPDIEKFRIIDDKRNSIWVVSDDNRGEETISDGNWSSIMKYEGLSQNVINIYNGNPNKESDKSGKEISNSNFLYWKSENDNSIYSDSTFMLNSAQHFISDRDGYGDFDYTSSHKLANSLELKNMNFVEDSTQRTYDLVSSLSVDDALNNNIYHPRNTELLDSIIPLSENSPTNIANVVRNYLHEGYFEQVNDVIKIWQNNEIPIQGEFLDPIQNYFNSHFDGKYSAEHGGTEAQEKLAYSPTKMIRVTEKSTGKLIYELAERDNTDSKTYFVYTPQFNYVLDDLFNLSGSYPTLSPQKDGLLDSVQILDTKRNIKYTVNDTDANGSVNDVWMEGVLEKSKLLELSGLKVEPLSKTTQYNNTTESKPDFVFQWSTIPNTAKLNELYYQIGITKQDNAREEDWGIKASNAVERWTNGAGTGDLIDSDENGYFNDEVIEYTTTNKAGEITENSVRSFGNAEYFWNYSIDWDDPRKVTEYNFNWLDLDFMNPNTRNEILQKVYNAAK